MQRAIYTVLVGGFDALLSPVHAEPELNYIAFTDESRAMQRPWQIRPLATRARNPRMTARWHKLHAHRLLPDYEESLYVDANILIRERIGSLFEGVLNKSPIALFRHPSRSCSYVEAEAVKRLRYDDAAIVDSQMAFYRAHGLPVDAGLHFCGIMFRRHNDPTLVKLQEDWWQQLKIFSHRDQLSLAFMLRRHGIAVEAIPGGLPNNRWFAIGPHRKYRVDFASGLAPGDADEVDWLRAAFANASRHAPRGWKSRLGDAGDSLIRLAKTPRTLIKRAVRRLAWRKYATRRVHAGRSIL